MVQKYQTSATLTNKSINFGPMKITFCIMNDHLICTWLRLLLHKIKLDKQFVMDEWMKCGCVCVCVCDAVVHSQNVDEGRQRPCAVAVTPASRRDMSTNRDAPATVPMMSTLCLETKYHCVMMSTVDELMIAISMITRYATLSTCVCNLTSRAGPALQI